MQKLLGCSMNNYRIVQTICNYNTSNTGTEPYLIIGTVAVVQTQYSQFQSIRHHLQRLTSEGNKKRNKFLSLLTGDNIMARSEEHTSELQSRPHLVCRLLLVKNTVTK